MFKVFFGVFVVNMFSEWHLDIDMLVSHFEAFLFLSHVCVCVCVCVRERERERDMGEI